MNTIRGQAGRQAGKQRLAHTSLVRRQASTERSRSRGATRQGVCAGGSVSHRRRLSACRVAQAGRGVAWLALLPSFRAITVRTDRYRQAGVYPARPSRARARAQASMQRRPSSNTRAAILSANATRTSGTTNSYLPQEKWRLAKRVRRYDHDRDHECASYL